ncbi:MAG: hypothetical protein C0606_14970 [Hyphomicrobiales bacterium]|nr:MAG: hypothetical protein C0606_14970 [Hyphomicrobiales bacterium]
MLAEFWEFFGQADRMAVIMITGIFIIVAGFVIALLRGHHLGNAFVIGLGVILAGAPIISHFSLTPTGGFTVKMQELTEDVSRLAKTNKAAIADLKNAVSAINTALVKIEPIMKSKITFSEIRTMPPSGPEHVAASPDIGSLEDEYARQLSTITGKISTLETTLKQSDTLQDKVERSLMELNSAVSR